MIQVHSFCQVFEPPDSVPVILNNSPAATLIATPNVNPVRTLAARKSEIQPIFSTYMMTKSAPATSTIEAANWIASSEPEEATARTAAPRTAAVDELGPCVTCFDVVKSANPIKPAAAA